MRKNLLMSAIAGIVICASCSTGKPQEALHAGSVWQNGDEIFIVEDSTSFWQLYGGTLHEGGHEMRLAKDGKWLVPAIVNNQPTDSIAGTWRLVGNTIRLTDSNNKASQLQLVSGLSILSRDDIPSKALPALDSVQQMSVFKQLEGAYTDNNGKKWTFNGNTLQRIGLKTKEKYAIGKSLDMNDCVILTPNIAFAYSLSNNRLLLYKAEHIDSMDVWEYDKSEKPLFILKKQ